VRRSQARVHQREVRWQRKSVQGGTRSAAAPLGKVCFPAIIARYHDAGPGLIIAWREHGHPSTRPSILWATTPSMVDVRRRGPTSHLRRAPITVNRSFPRMRWPKPPPRLWLHQRC